ncbi:MAG: hypothetical protein ACXVXP_00425 [Mycobacteriaceae bacterium]
MPTLTDTGQRLYDSIAPLMSQDADNGYVGAVLCGALATMLDPAAYVARDQEGGLPGWGIVFDVENVEAQWLPWLSQFVGDSAAVTATSDVATQRALISHPVNFLRGRPATIVAAAQTTLTGTKTVLINQNTGGSPWALTIATFTSETPDPVATRNAIMSVMPAWLVPTINTVTGGDYLTLSSSHASYSAMEAAHTHYSDIPTNPAA